MSADHPEIIAKQTASLRKARLDKRLSMFARCTILAKRVILSIRPRGIERV
jgi:hypothetical protein